MKHRVLIVGVGSIGERHFRCAQRTERAEVSICEINAELRRSVAEKYRVQQAFADIDAALAAQPTAAVICAPAHVHVPLAIQLAESRVHVLIEKPLSTSLEGIERLAQLVAKQRLVAAVAYIHRANPSLGAMRQALHDGRFGRPLQLTAVTGQDFAFHRPAYRTTYYRDRATGGGAIQDALTHLVNAAEWLVGPIDRLLADAAHEILPDVAVEDTVHLLSRHEKVPACYALNQFQAPNEFAITVVCERGTVRYEAHHQRWRWMTEPNGAWHDEPASPYERDDLFVHQLNVFFDAIEFGKPVLCTLDEGLQTLKVNLAALKSAAEVRWTTMEGLR